MQMIVIKMYVKKALVWLKNHWYVPALFLGACAIWFFYRQKASAIFDNLMKSREAHKQEISELTKIQEQEIASRDKNLDDYRNAEKMLKDKIESDKLEVAKEKARREKELMKKEVHDIAKELAKKEHLK